MGKEGVERAVVEVQEGVEGAVVRFVGDNSNGCFLFGDKWLQL